MSVPKAILYYDLNSVWSRSAILALEEKGYADDEVERKVVDLLKGENLTMAFLRISQKGLVPALVVPLANSLSTEDEHRYKAITEVKALLEFLDKSRSAVSRTHTTSQAPAPALTPATIAQTSTSNNIISIVHSPEAEPNNLVFYNAFDNESLRNLSSDYTNILQGKLNTINGLITASQNAPVSASDRTRRLWNEQKVHTEALLAVYRHANKSDEELSVSEKEAREQYFKKAAEAWRIQLGGALIVIDKEFVGPYALGDQLSITDLHLGPWFIHVASLLGCSLADDGDEVLSRLEARIGNQFAFPRNFQLLEVPDLHSNPTEEVSLGEKRAKLAVYWDVLRARPSWKKVYGIAE